MSAYNTTHHSYSHTNDNTSSEYKDLVLNVWSPQMSSWFTRVGLGLCCLMTPGLSKDIRVHTFPNLQFTRSDIRPHIKWAVSLVIAYGHFNLPQGFVWVCKG